MPSTRCTAPQSTPSAAWCLRTASSSGASSRQYTLPSSLWYSSTCRTPNSSARLSWVSAVIWAMASAGSLRSSWKSMNCGMSLTSRDLSRAGESRRGERLPARGPGPVGQHRDKGRDERGADRDERDLPARHPADDGDDRNGCRGLHRVVDSAAVRRREPACQRRGCGGRESNQHGAERGE